MKKVLKNNSGITVLSLIVTVIIMIILVGITINSTIGEGSIISNAGNVVEKYNDTVPQEKDKIHEIEDYFTDKVDKYGK